MIKKVRLSESVVDAIRQMIADMGYTAGDKFLTEKELTERLNVSRSSVREAVRMLEATGQVTVRQGKGIFVAHGAPRTFDAFVSWLRDNEQSVLEHFEVRLIIEPKTAWQAAENARPEDVRALEKVCDAFERNAEVDNTTETIRYDREFHKLLAKATRNKTLAALMRSLSTALLDGWISSFHTPGRMDKTVSEHRAILRAVRDRNPQAAKEAMATHLENAIQEIMLSAKQAAQPTGKTIDNKATGTRGDATAAQQSESLSA